MAWCAAASARIVGPEELAADGEAAEALGLLDARLLQQRQCPAAGADEDELRVDLARLAGAAVEHLERPAAVGLLAQVAHLVTEQRRHAALGGVPDELAGQRTEVDVGAVLGPVQRDGLGEVALGGHQRQPAGELVVVVDELHRGEQRVLHQRLAPALEVVDVAGAVHEADVRDRD